MMEFIHDVLPTVSGRLRQIFRAPAALHDDRVVWVNHPNGLIEVIEIIPLEFAGGGGKASLVIGVARRLIEQVIGGDVFVVFVMLCKDGPKF